MEIKAGRRKVTTGLLCVEREQVPLGQAARAFQAWLK